MMKIYLPANEELLDDDDLPAVETQITTAPKNTMPSFEIAEITGRNHADVMRDIGGTLDQDEGGARPMTPRELIFFDLELLDGNLATEDAKTTPEDFSEALRSTANRYHQNRALALDTEQANSTNFIEIYDFEIYAEVGENSGGRPGKTGPIDVDMPDREMTILDDE